MLKIRIETKNSAFEDDLIYQLRLCLSDVKDKLQEGIKEAKIYESNGNPCGYFKLTNR